MADKYAICPTCQALNSRSEQFCEQCGASTENAEATSIPVTGVTRTGVYKPWRKILLVGLWMIFLPAFLSNAYAAIYFLRHRRGLAELIFFWGSVGLTLLAFTILYRATK